MGPGAVASEVARASGIHTSQLFRWRQQLCERAQIPAAFNEVAIAPEPSMVPAPSPERAGVIEIEFATIEVHAGCARDDRRGTDRGSS
jgi:transposase